MDNTIGCIHHGEKFRIGKCPDEECINSPNYLYRNVPHISGIPIHKFGTHDTLTELVEELRNQRDQWKERALAAEYQLLKESE